MAQIVARLRDAANGRIIEPFVSPQRSGAGQLASTVELSGPNEVRVLNPNAFQADVELRCERGTKSFSVAPNGTASANVPNGRFDIFFEYSNEPGARYQGDSFTLTDGGIEIQLVKVVSGNYGVRRVN
jgi:hypothetical protein